MLSPDSRQLRALAFFGGGTGGHLFPGVAVAERATERFPGCRVLFFRTSRPVEDKVFSGCSFPTHTLRLESPSGGARAWLRYWTQSLRVVPEIARILRQGFDAAFGLGGYASLPGILAARCEKIPVVLLEQNLVPGRVNRMLAPFVSAVSCPDTLVKERLRGHSEVTGNPVRRRVLEAAEWRRQRACNGKSTVLVMGGSQGAHRINQAIVTALPDLTDFRTRVRWIHLSGPVDREFLASSYRDGGWEARVLEWSGEIPDLMAESDLVVARAGGTTLAELAILGVPAVLVPYPHHRDGHQEINATRFAKSGAARLVAQSELNASTLRSVFGEILFSPARLREMEESVQRLARPRAADAVLDLVLKCQPHSVSFC